MLGYEDGVPAHRRLLAVIFWGCRGKPLADEVCGMDKDRFDPTFPKIGFVLRVQTEAGAERRPRKPRKKCVEVVHGLESDSKLFGGLTSPCGTADERLH
jgi:hypothetical protein